MKCIIIGVMIVNMITSNVGYIETISLEPTQTIEPTQSIEQSIEPTQSIEITTEIIQSIEQTTTPSIVKTIKPKKTPKIKQTQKVIPKKNVTPKIVKEAESSIIVKRTELKTIDNKITTEKASKSASSKPSSLEIDFRVTKEEKCFFIGFIIIIIISNVLLYYIFK
jgi:cytoskeletal protein RodZ